jgi:hypothetical protein
MKPGLLHRQPQMMDLTGRDLPWHGILPPARSAAPPARATSIPIAVSAANLHFRRPNRRHHTVATITHPEWQPRPGADHTA